jgi:hypothetical protein
MLSRGGEIVMDVVTTELWNQRGPISFVAVAIFPPEKRVGGILGMN